MKCQILLATCLVAALSVVYADEGPAPAQGLNQQAQPQLQPVPQAFTHQQQRPVVPYPLRRQSGMERARQTVMGFMRSIIDAGSRFRRMASERFSTMFARRSAPARRSQQQRVEGFRRQQQ